jgi:hypothetical protein
MPKAIRRVVTGHNVAGRSVFIADGPAPHVFTRGPGGVAVTDLWMTRATPADNTGDADPVGAAFQIPPPQHGSVFRIVEYPPDAQRVAALRQTQPQHGTPTHGDDALYRPNARHPGFHKTDTIDYAIVLSGEIYALMDEGEVLLRPGDVLVQRGTSHAWSNRTDAPAVLAFVLIDAHPV